MSWIPSMIRYLAGIIGCRFLAFAEPGRFSDSASCLLEMRSQPPKYSYLSVAALIVGFTALLCSTALLVYQYLATTDGYRRCQPSIMGQWAKKTRLRWNWSQLRFETLFMVPEIVLCNGVAEETKEDMKKEMGKGENTVDTEIEWITGSSESRNRTYSSLTTTKGINDDGELVCWLGLLGALHEHELDLQNLNGHQSLPSGSDQPRPAVKFRQKTWDLTSPHAIRPHAVCSTSDIAILARRLGMTWQDFRPYEGIMRAEGNGHLLVSTFSRSIGIVLQYMRVGESSPNNIYIQSTPADMLGFGILTGFAELDIPTFKIGHIAEVLATADLLDPLRRASQKISDVRGIEPKCLFGFSDLISMASPMMRTRGSTVVRLPAVSEYTAGLTCHKEGFVVFHEALQTYIAYKNKDPVSAQVHWVSQQYKALKAEYAEWEDEALALDQCNDRSLAFLEKVHTLWDETTRYFQRLSTAQDPHHLRYYDLVASHITHAINYWGDAWYNIREKKTRNHYGLRDWLEEGAYCYWDYLPLIATEMRRRGFEGEDKLIDEAWMMMMFRAFCWWRCHYMCAFGEEGGKVEQGIEVSRLPSRYWGSKLPVYIGQSGGRVGCGRWEVVDAC